MEWQVVVQLGWLGRVSSQAATLVVTQRMCSETAVTEGDTVRR